MTTDHRVNIFKNYWKHQRNIFYYKKVENIEVKNNGEEYTFLGSWDNYTDYLGYVA